MTDALYHDVRYRTFNIIDGFKREGFAIEVETSIRAEWVVTGLERLKTARKLLGMIRVDNAPEFLAQKFQDWGKVTRVLIYHIQPGGSPRMRLLTASIVPMGNEVPNLYPFRSLEKVRDITSSWITIYDEQRPHEALQRNTLCTYKTKSENSIC